MHGMVRFNAGLYPEEALAAMRAWSLPALLSFID